MFVSLQFYKIEDLWGHHLMLDEHVDQNANELRRQLWLSFHQLVVKIGDCLLVVSWQLQRIKEVFVKFWDRFLSILAIEDFFLIWSPLMTVLSWQF